MFFCVQSDWDPNKPRKHPTPSINVMLKQLDKFVDRFKNMTGKNCEKILSEPAIEEIKKIRIHIMKGFLSNIPVKAASSQNEKLHKHLNKGHLHSPHISPPLSIALFYVFFNRWNARVRNIKNCLAKASVLLQPKHSTF